MPRELVVTLRESLQGGGDSPAVVLRDLRRAADLARDPACPPADRERALVTLAVLIHGFLAGEPDKEFSAEALRLLLSLGRAGTVLGLKHLRRRGLPAPEAAKLLLSGSGPEQLALLNQYFQAPRDLDPALDAALWKAFLALASGGAELLLDHLARGPRLALPIQRVLVEGAFWMWMRRLFQGGLAPEETAYVARGLAALESPEVAAFLAARLGAAPPGAVEALVGAVAAAGPSRDPRVLGPLAGLLDHAEPRVRRAALAALLTVQAPRAALAFLKCRRQEGLGAGSLAPEVLRLNGAEFRALLSRLDAPGRSALVLELFSALARFFPAFLKRFLSAAQAGEGERLALLDFASAHKWPRSLAKLFHPPGGAEAAPWYGPVADVALPEKKKAGLFGRKPAEGPSLAAQLAAAAPPEASGNPSAGRAGGQSGGQGLGFSIGAPGGQAAGPSGGGQVTGVSAPGQELSGGAYRGLTLRGAVLNRCRLEGVAFADCAFLQADLRGARLGKASFTNCRFVNVRLGEAVLAAATFTGCRFEGCDAVRASAERCRFTDCEWSGCLLDQSAWTSCVLAGCQFEACLLRGASFRGVEASGVGFESTDLGQAFLAGCRFTGLGLSGCDFSGARGRDLLLDGATVADTSFEGASFLDLCTFDPDFLAAEARTLERILSGASAGGTDTEAFSPLPAPPECAGRPALALAARAVAEWIGQREAKDRCRLALAQDRRRLAWATAKMGAEPGRFPRLLPLALSADLGAPAGRAFAHLPCRVDGSVPTPGERRLLERCLPGARLGEPAHSLAHSLADNQAGGQVHVLGLYAIGSLGSVAQTGDSDLDLWVVFSPDSPRGEALRPFLDKLAWLEKWADSAFGLEVHFFPMELAKVRANDFGLSDEEGAGSSLALLLKEEFYRTGLRLAGRVPAWLLTDPGADEAAHAAQVRRLEGLAVFPAGGLADLGHLGQIPEGEFFGASLWQMVKALKSPFKSVLKLGLVDRSLTHREEAGTLLCDRLKANLHHGLRDLWSIDPYALLFKEVNDHYLARGDQDTLLLLGMAFCLKAGVGGRDDTFPAHNPRVGSSLGDYFYPSSSFRPEDKVRAAQGGLLTFAGRAEAGQRVAQFMASAYQRISQGLTQGVAARISRQDLTKLGRRIMAHFAPRENKVMRVPFMSSPKGLFGTISFAADGGQWVARGQFRAGPGVRAEPEAIRREAAPMRLMAWLMANGVYTPDAYLQIDPALSPVSAEDVTALMRALHEFFPWKRTFDPGMEEGLSPERVVRAFFVSNLRAPRQETALVELAIVYSTNWGEMFCLPEVRNPARAELAPLSFLKPLTQAEVGHGVIASSFKPKHAACPDLQLI
jgi:adenylate cyclase class 1